MLVVLHIRYVTLLLIILDTGNERIFSFGHNGPDDDRTASHRHRHSGHAHDRLYPHSGSSHGRMFSLDRGELDGDFLTTPSLMSYSETQNVTVPVGGTARFYCYGETERQETVSWIRLHDYHILTNGLVKFSADNRFSVLHQAGSNDWSLQIMSVQPRDEGEYQCQVATVTGVRTLSAHLSVARPRAFILGSRDKHVEQGGQVTLTCELRDSPARPEFVFWFLNNTMVNFLGPGTEVHTSVVNKDTVSLWVPQPNTTVSNLVIHKVEANHQGNYTCAPSNSKPDSIRLFVSKESGLEMKRLEKVKSGNAATSTNLELPRKLFPILISSLITFN